MPLYRLLGQIDVRGLARAHDGMLQLLSQSITVFQAHWPLVWPQQVSFTHSKSKIPMNNENLFSETTGLSAHSIFLTVTNKRLKYSSL